MYTVFSTFNVPDEKAEEVIGIYKNRSKSVDEAPGFVDFLLLQNDKRAGELTVQLTFDTKENYLSWVRSEDFKRIHDLEKKYPDQELAAVIPKVSQYKVVAR
ncbi:MULTISPECIES: antibiotic biosynthesis monooxygenase family protein [Priestia]|jgi:heme-degrading monooxygenase HmoA|uniref:Antibiotic biosynthesis monooxygenase domain protein n=7 Tax=Priestia TaxID=2800373 RepID=D5DX46_PRIM1|nr:MULTISPECIES: antibiotic biosynthesis monooxygenase [Priestia]AVX09083.1 antibiotic biosynthesis monooxygenase [Bacillus sp. Y-01]KOP75216.1 antibiotic biosynthesis monooxygenase [Bacillus sp. FJAT-21351]KQU16845.1 antibiotic biosynthesis monooxygenase [Bacillus sp. Leaf75]KRD90634.1 antibiotic biosynthesis monooxygenase [Bacillus sp. Root147]KRD99549.1 antibiotic biosynthesis monooxygenase [Bacillus sp. Root239]KRF56518.1 antibiotic biosynthesis monooxygenase [Bacillus sp. Soil531]MBK000